MVDSHRMQIASTPSSRAVGHWLVLAATCALLSSCGTGTTRPADADDDSAFLIDGLCADPSFSRSVLPVLQQRCSQCHRPNAALGGLSLHSHEGVMDGGLSGAVVVPGDCAGSLLYQAVSGQASSAMPPTGYERLGDADVSCICEWIERGAPDD